LPMPLRRRLTPTSAQSSHHHQELCTSPPQLPEPRASPIDLWPAPPLPNPLRSSHHKRLHVHHRLRPSSSPAATTTSSHQRTVPLQLVNSHHRPSGHAVTVELARPTADAVGSLTPVRTPPSDPKIRSHSMPTCS
jgi:hypothetical protein